jgi:hypothetical protein
MLSFLFHSLVHHAGSRKSKAPKAKQAKEELVPCVLGCTFVPCMTAK